MKRINRAFRQVIALSFGLPSVLGLASKGTLRGGLTGCCGGRLARIFI